MEYTSFSKWLVLAYRRKGTFVPFLCMEFYMYGILNKDNVLVESAANPIRKGVSQVNVYEVFVVIFAFGTFLVTLLTLVVRIMNKK
ncbi:hypothetical protein A21D_00205 [Virgibacillus dokdonensis]|nr:hypothetical protein A21D_00205 [Virgibacillus dokdonensis]